MGKGKERRKRSVRVFSASFLFHLPSFPFLFIAFSLLGCTQAPPPPPAPSLPYSLITPNAAATVTPTPFQPNYAQAATITPAFPFPTATPDPKTSPTPTLTPWGTNTAYIQPTYIQGAEGIATPNFYGDLWENYPEPAYYPLNATIPQPVGMLPQPKDQINILLLGSDIRPYSTDFRTDTIILLTVDKQTASVNMTSFPRDLYIYIPGWTMQRINTAMAHGGFHTLAMTMAYNFGVYPDHYLMIDFANFIQIINSLGGIEVEVGHDFSDQRTGYGWYYVQQGTVHMDGDTALWYIRSRYTSSDIDRLRRAQEIIQAIGYRLLSFDVLKRAPELFPLYKASVQTDLELGDALSLLPTAKKLLETQEINRYAIGYGPVYDWTDPYTGAMLLLPHRELIMPIMHKALNLP